MSRDSDGAHGSGVFCLFGEEGVDPLLTAEPKLLVLGQTVFHIIYSA